MGLIARIRGVAPRAGAPIAPRTRPRLWAKVCLLFATLVLCFLVGEVFVRLVMVTDHHEFVTDEELLWRNRPNQVSRLRNDPSAKKPRLITTDERGFRRTAPPPAPGARRVLAFGDSLMFGEGLDDSETFCSQLQALCDGKLDIVNAAVPGWGLFQEEIQMRRLIETVRPEIVFVHYGEWDVRRQPFPADQPHLRRKFLWESRLRNTIRHYTKLGSLLGHLVMKAVLNHTKRGLLNEVVDQGQDANKGPSPVFLNCWDADRKRLIAMKDLAERHGAKFVLIFGTWMRGSNGPFLEAELAKLAREQGMIPVHLTEVLKPYTLEELTQLPLDAHPSALWNRLTAGEIHRTLVSAGLIEGDPRSLQVVDHSR